MTPSPACISANENLRKVAQLMEDHDCGCIPVVDDRDNRRVVGVITDRDIAIRAIAQGKGPETKVTEIMTADATCCSVDDDLDAVEQVMAEKQIRRVVIVDADGYCRGIIAQADLARAADRLPEGEHDLARVVERISQPAESPAR
ncbi:MAG TPA: CBS domain-containing protein [Gemmatimonadaceae bacterium]|nr:CBS domain-containing protein [Gemmatimonadaceae bacterium]